MVHSWLVTTQGGVVGVAEGVEEDSVVEDSVVEDSVIEDSVVEDSSVVVEDSVELGSVEDVEVVVASAVDVALLRLSVKIEDEAASLAGHKHLQRTGWTRQEHAELTLSALLAHWVWTGAKSVATV